MQDDSLRSAVADRHLEPVEDELGAEMVGHGRADHLAAPGIEDDGEGTVKLGACRLAAAQLDGARVTPHIAQNTSGRASAIDGRTTRHAGYLASQRVRKRIEEAFGWIKSSAGQARTRLRGIERVRWSITLTAAAYNLIRLPKLIGAGSVANRRRLDGVAPGRRHEPLMPLAVCNRALLRGFRGEKCPIRCAVGQLTTKK